MAKKPAKPKLQLSDLELQPLVTEVAGTIGVQSPIELPEDDLELMARDVIEQVLAKYRPDLFA